MLKIPNIFPLTQNATFLTATPCCWRLLAQCRYFSWSALCRAIFCDTRCTQKIKNREYFDFLRFYRFLCSISVKKYPISVKLYVLSTRNKLFEIENFVAHYAGISRKDYLCFEINIIFMSKFINQLIKDCAKLYVGARWLCRQFSKFLFKLRGFFSAELCFIVLGRNWLLKKKPEVENLVALSRWCLRCPVTIFKLSLTRLTWTAWRSW